MQILDTVKKRCRIDGTPVPSTTIPETASDILYEKASKSVADRFAVKVRLLRKYAEYLIKTDNLGTITGFHAELEKSKKEEDWIPDVRTLQLWIVEQKLSPTGKIPLPQKRGPNGPRITNKNKFLDILMGEMAQSYPTKGAKKKPRNVPFMVAYKKMVKTCVRDKTTPIPSETAMRRLYAGISPLEKEAIKLCAKDLESKFGVRSTNPISENLRVQLDYQHLKYIEFHRGQRTFHLQLAVPAEMNTGCILSPSLFEGSLNSDKLNAVVYNTLTTGSDPELPSLLQVDVFEIDGESSNRSLEKSAALLCGLGTEIRIGLPAKGHQRGKVERKHGILQTRILPQMETILREFVTANKSYVVKDKQIEEAYAICEEVIAKFVQEYNSEEVGNTGKSRLELFNESFGARRMEIGVDSLHVLSHSHLCTGRRIGQVEILLPSQKKVLVHNEKIAVGQQYKVLQIRGSEETFFVFDTDGKSLGKGTILRPGSESRKVAESASRRLLAKAREKAKALRIKGAERNLRNYRDQALPIEGARSVIRSEAAQENPPLSSCKRKRKGIEKGPVSNAKQRIPEPVPIPKKYTRINLGAFEI